MRLCAQRHSVLLVAYGWRRSVTPPKLRGSSHECNERATRVQMPLMPRSRRQKGRGQNESTTREQQGSAQKRSTKRLIRARQDRCGELRLLPRAIENLNCVAYAKAAGTPTDARAKQ